MMRYQIEKPSDTDMFASKGHENSAFAIKDVIEHHSDVHVIGLEGSLGAGKSTVIELLKNKLPPAKYKFITFDVEKYHSSTKASFLKVIHRKLQEFYGKNKALDEAKNRALGNTIEYEKEVDSNLNWITVIFVITMIFSVRFIPDAIKPFFTLIPEAPNPKNINNVTPYSKEHWTYILLSLIPAIILIITGIFGCDKVRNKVKNIPILKYIKKLPKIGSIIKKNGKDTIKETLVVNKEVGSTELESAFESFIEIIPENHTVILVIDNLDRVESEKVREVWSDLEIFTSLCNGKLRVIVPFSQEHIAKALSNDGQSSGQEFISKRLPVIFKAPPIVSAGWREPFKTFWNQTLPNREGIEQCCELIDVWVTAKGKLVTPRFLKKHINDIATLVTSNAEVNPNAAVCSAYLLISKFSNLPFRYLLSTPDDANEGNQKSIDRTKKILRKSLTNEEWATQVMCIHFQSTEDIARSELLEEPIRAAISSVESHKLFELSKLFGFKEAFDKYLATNDPYNVIHSLGDLLDRKEIEEAEKLEWINTYLGAVNHYLREERDNTDISHYDSDLVNSYEQLISHNINIDIQRIENEISTLSENIRINSQGNIDELLEQLHDYSYITKSTPIYINNIDVKTFFTNLWDKREELKNWNIKNIRKTEVKIKENIKYIEDNDLTNEVTSYFGVLKNLNKLTQKTVAEKWHPLSKLPIASILNFDNGYDILPITHLWSKPQYCLNLLQKIQGIKNKDTNYYAWISITICYIIENNLYDNLYAINPANPNIRVKAGDFIKEKISTDLDILINNLSNDLTFITSFQKIVVALERSFCSESLSKSVMNAISWDKIKCINPKSVAKDNWSTLSEIFTDDKSILLDWFSGWEPNFPDVDDWSSQLIIDSTKYNKSPYIEKIEDHVNNDLLDIDYWEECISSINDNTTELFNWLSGNSKIIRKSSNITQAIINILKEDNYESISIDKDSLSKVISTIPTLSKNKLIRHIEGYIENKASNSEYVYFLISHFDNLITLPDALRVNYSEKTLILLDNINDQLIADWFDLQEYDYSSWTKDQQEKFMSAIEELESQYSVPKLSAVADSLKPVKDDEESDDDEAGAEPVTA